MPRKWSLRKRTYFNLYGYSTDLVVCNRLIPNTVSDDYFKHWKISQEEYYKTIEERFSPLPILAVPLMQTEIVGLKMLRECTEKL